MAKPAAQTVVQGGRAKAFRPIPAADRQAAFAAALAAYDRGDFFLTHELLEPAWMGTDDLPERELYQGLIKLAAAFVHGVRGNPQGIARNLEGARERLAAAAEAGRTEGLDLAHLLTAIDDRLARLANDPDASPIEPPSLRRTTP
jgi:predicted metal-dependent hydrolase